MYTKSDMYKGRIKRLRDKMGCEGNKAYMITKKANQNYMTGFTGEADAVVVTNKNVYILTNSLYVVQGKTECPDFVITDVKKEPDKCIRNIMLKENISILACEYPVKYIEQKKELLDNYSVEKLIEKSSLIEEYRIIKDEYELSCIKKAADITSAAFNHCLQFIKPGVTEIEIAAELEYFMKKNGSFNEAFDTVVASGLRSGMPHGNASLKKIEKGDTVTLDFGATVNSYCSDMTRTVFVGKPLGEMKKIYNIVLKAQKLAVDSVRAGITAEELDKTARELIEKEGYGKFFIHGLGHGTGLLVHEAPKISKDSRTILQKNMVITVEPGIYIKNVGGVRIEDLTVVNENKCEILSKDAPKEMIIL